MTLDPNTIVAILAMIVTVLFCFGVIYSSAFKQ